MSQERLYPPTQPNYEVSGGTTPLNPILNQTLAQAADLLIVGDDVINKALSGNSELYLRDIHQRGGQ